MNSYDFRDRVVMEIEYRHPKTNVLVDPDLVLARVRTPAGQIQTLSVTKVSTGVYSASILATIAGTWYYVFESQGTAESVSEASFYVRPTKVPKP